MKKSLIIMACLSVAVVALTACQRESGFSAGTEMTADEIRAYREKILAEAASEQNSSKGTADSEQNSEQNGEQNTEEQGNEQREELPCVCYYVKNSEVWHASKSCSYLKNAKDIIEGDPQGAQAAGKLRPCSRCASNWK